MAARDLVVRPGDRVSVAGGFVARADGDWLDVALIDNLTFHPPDWVSSYALRVVGVDPAAVPREWGPDAEVIPGRVRVTGIWDGEVISVDHQEPYRREPWKRSTFRPPCPPPEGGWDASVEHHDVPELEGLRETGAIAVDQWMREDGGAVVLIVAATDPDRVRAVLGPRLPRRLCVVESRYRAAEVREAHDVLHGRWRDWGIQRLSGPGLRAGQPYVEAHLLRVSDEIAEWADTLPEGLLVLSPIMRPA